MYSALYFPHTEIQSERLVKTALLTWDRLETIAPYRGYQTHYEGEMAAAMELIGKPRSPTEAEKVKVHALVKELVDQTLPETFSYRPERWEETYEMWAQKLSPKTWELLAEHGLIGGRLENTDFPASQPAGLTVMSIVADVLAGQTRTRVTDRAAAYATIANAPKTAQDATGADTFQQIVPLTFKTIAVEHIPLGALVALRRREEIEANGRDYRHLRHNYLNRLHAYVQEAAQHLPGSSDREELDFQFEREMDDDLKDLQRELRIAGRDTFLSKDMMTFAALGLAAAAAAAAAGQLAGIPMAITNTLTGAAITIGGGVNMFPKYGDARRKALAAHPMAYLYELDQRR